MTDSEPGNPEHSRRRFLRYTGTMGLVGAAGCSGGGSATDTTETETAIETETATETPTATATPTATETSTDTATPTDTPTYSYERITGSWTAPTYEEGVAEHSYVKLEISEEAAKPREETGTLKLLVKKDGEVHCKSTLTAHESDPPKTFSLWANADNFPCDSHMLYEFEPAGPKELKWYLVYRDGGITEFWNLLSQENGQEGAHSTTRERIYRT